MATRPVPSPVGHERLQPFWIRPPHENAQHIRQDQDDRNRRMRFDTLRAHPTRQLDAIANRPPHRAECRRQAPAHFPMHRQRCGEQPERLERHVRRELAHGRPRIVTETNATCDLLQIGSQRSVGLLQRRLKRREQARTRPQRTDQQIDRLGKLGLDPRRPLFSNLLLDQVRDHADQSSRRDRNLDGQAREEPERAQPRCSRPTPGRTDIAGDTTWKL